MFLSIIDNPKYEIEMGRHLIENKRIFNHLSDNFYVSGDHTRADIQVASIDTIQEKLMRMITVKKGEFMIGKVLTPDSKELGEKNLQQAFFEKTLDDILPIYDELMKVYFKDENNIQE